MLFRDLCTGVDCLYCGMHVLPHSGNDRRGQQEEKVRPSKRHE